MEESHNDYGLRGADDGVIDSAEDDDDGDGDGDDNAAAGEPS